MDVFALTRYIVDRAKKQNKFISNLKLQKILYYVNGYAFKYYNELIFQEEIKAWQYGPVYPTVYFGYNFERVWNGTENTRETVFPSQRAQHLVDMITPYTTLNAVCRLSGQIYFTMRHKGAIVKTNRKGESALTDQTKGAVIGYARVSTQEQNLY